MLEDLRKELSTTRPERDCLLRRVHMVIFPSHIALLPHISRVLSNILIRRYECHRLADLAIRNIRLLLSSLIISSNIWRHHPQLRPVGFVQVPVS